MTRHLSYWLVPSAEDRSFLQDLITTLARVHQAPSFIPHVTIYSGESQPDDHPLDIIEQSTQDVESLTLQVDTVLSTDQFTKTLFIQLHPSPRLSAISERIRTLSSKPSDYILSPHVSLLYKQMRAPEKHRLATTILLPQTEVAFGDVWAIASWGPTQTPADVQRWEIVCRKQLR